MLDTLFNTFIKGPLYSGIYTETWEDIADGGPTCFKELSVGYRVTVALGMAVFQLLVLWFSLNQVRKKYPKKQEALGKIKPHPIEVFFGYCAILVFAIQAVYKLSSGKGIFLLNPCHVVLLMEAYVLIFDKTEKSQVMYANVVSLLFSPVCGILYAVDIGLHLPFEREMYWVEHYLGAIIIPLALSISGRYHERKFFHPYYRLIGFAFFSLYHRLVLLPFALATWANIDQTLCHCETDPFYSTFGDWYYLAADFYIPIASNVIAYPYLIICEIVALLKYMARKGEERHEQKKKEAVKQE